MKRRVTLSLITFLYIAVTLILLRFEFGTSFESNEISTFKLDQSGQLEKKRVIFLLIDAAKYSYWREIEILPKLIEKYPNNSLIFKSIASSPTMTTQKLQTLMTGSPTPSSTSILDSFFSTRTPLDNLPLQIHRNGGEVISLGDQTWGKLFAIQKEYPCVNTYNVYDWDSCDQIVYTHFIQEMGQGGHMIVGHLLALDHVGHSTSSTNSPHFQPKKQKISNFISEVVEQMKDTDILLITGDHGMRDDGNHGGASDQQIQTFLFSYSKTPISPISKVTQITQPDITSTLSILLDVPVPRWGVGVPVFVEGGAGGAREGGEGEERKRRVVQRSLGRVKGVARDKGVCGQYLQNGGGKEGSVEEMIDEAKKLQECLSQSTTPTQSLLPMLLGIFILGSLTLLLSILSKTTLKQTLIILLVSIAHPISWLLIRNSSTYFMLALVVGVFGFGGVNLDTFWRVGIVVLVAQGEIAKNGEFQTNFAKIVNLSSQYRITLRAIMGVFWAIYMIKNRTKVQGHGLKGKLLNWGDFTVIGLITISYIFRLLNLVQLSVYLNITTICLTSLIILQKLLLGSKIPSTLSLPLFLFLGPQSPLIFLLTSLFLKGQNPSPRNNSIVGALWGHWLWWVMGNRYEYSSIDILQSYVFGVQYHWLRNSVCMGLYMMAPYLLTIITMVSNKQNKDVSMLPQDETTVSSQNVLTLAQSQIKSQRQKYEMWRFLLIPMTWLISCLVALVYNHEKILYTVVYVPMTVIEVTKIVILIICCNFCGFLSL